MDSSLMWSECVDLLKSAGELSDLTLEPNNERLMAELRRQFVMNLAQGYYILFQSDPRYPDWIPFLNSAFLLQPNPDDIYHLAAVDGRGVYRLFGNRGTTKIATIALHRGIQGITAAPWDISGYCDLDDLRLEAGGDIEILLSENRPSGYDGNWIHLDPDTKFVLLRNRAYCWGEEREAFFGIERLDGSIPLKPRWTAQEINNKIRSLMGIFVKRLSRHWLEYQNLVFQRGIVNRIELVDFGGVMPAQQYWQGVYQLESDEALILETEIPAKHRYWNVQLNDELWNASEFLYRQGSLNGSQATIDQDGRFRAVISIEDPGVANWLDPNGSSTGMIIGRWYEADQSPIPSLRRVKFKDRFKYLAGNVLCLTPEERSQSLRARCMSGQLRRRW